jgi:hypothetical protein
MSRTKFMLVLVLAAMAIAFGGMACIDQQVDIERIDEGFGAT